jgi:TctA family transporter
MASYLKALVLSVLAVFAPAKTMILTSFALVMMDLITGLIAAKKTNTPITSAGLRRSISKLLIYEVAILLGFLTQQYMTGPSVPVSNIIAGLVGVTELTSCLENLNTISDGGILKIILDKISSAKDGK